MMNHGVVHFEIPATNPDKLSEFYRGLFGWHIEKMDMGGTAYYSVATVPVDEQGMPREPGAIGGGMYERQAPDQTVVNYVNVESVDSYLAKAKQMGATEMVGKMPVPGMGWFAQLKDPDGNVFGLWQTDTGAA